MDSITTNFGEVLLWSFWFFIWIAALMVWFRCLVDLFSDSSLSGWAKAGWALLLIFLPWLGALIYLIARGRSMTERQRAALEQRQAEQDRYIQAGCRHLPGPGRADRQRQGAARFRSPHAGRVRVPQGQGAHLTAPYPRPDPGRCPRTLDPSARLGQERDAQIAGILNRQNRSTATGLPFTAGRVQVLRHHWNIPCHQSSDTPAGDQPLTIVDAAAELKLPPPTLHRWITEGFITGEQITPGAPWRIRLTDQVRALFVDEAPDGWLAMLEATLAHGLSRKAIMKNIKTGDLQAVYVRTGRRKGLRIEPPAPEQALFQP